MASTAGGQLDPEPYVRIVRNAGMLNRTLQAICTNEGLNKNGVKAELQQRIIDRMYKRLFLPDSRYSHLLPACRPYEANNH
jgi:hypothetical protein